MMFILGPFALAMLASPPATGQSTDTESDTNLDPVNLRGTPLHLKDKWLKEHEDGAVAPGGKLNLHKDGKAVENLRSFIDDTSACNDPVFPDDFRWNSAGVPSGYDCIQIVEGVGPSEYTWHDNYFCWKKGKNNPGMRWSSAGKISSMRCTQILEAKAESWQDNYLCVPETSYLHFSWSFRGPIAGKTCIQWKEASDPRTWHDNFLCASNDPVFPNDFLWSSAGVPAGYDCNQIIEKYDPKKTWSDNYFCWKCGFKNPGMRWSSAGKISNMRCTQILESKAESWQDNYLCVPETSNLDFSWSSSGPIAGKTCIQWKETSDPRSWHDNFLCAPNNFQDDPVFPNDFRWSSAGVPAGYDCIQIWEDVSSFQDNFFCWKHGFKNPGMRWSYAGEITDMRCAQIEEKKTKYFDDNYLCVPESSELHFVFSSAGEMTDFNCMQWQERDVYSWNDNYLCDEKCSVTAVEVLENEFDPVYEGTQVIGVVSGSYCDENSDFQMTLSLSSFDSVTDTVGIETTTESGFSFAVGMEVSVEASGKLFGIGGSLTATKSFTAETSSSVSYSESEDVSKGTETGVGCAYAYKSQGAALLVGVSRRYKVDGQNIPARFTFSCPKTGGSSFTKDSVINLKSHTYQAAHCEPFRGETPPDTVSSEACDQVGTCVQNVGSANTHFFGDLDQVGNDFDQCFTFDGTRWRLSVETH